MRGIYLDIPRGAIVSLLGPKGAGNSILINILAGLVIKSRARWELLEFQAGLYGVPPAERRTDEILAAVHRAGLGIAYLTPEEGDLEDIFLVLISSKEAEA